MTAKPTYHWTKKQLAPKDTQERYVLYLFDETGTFQGYVQTISDNLYEAYVGRPSETVGVFDTLEEAKGAVLYCLTGEE